MVGELDDTKALRSGLGESMAFFFFSFLFALLTNRKLESVKIYGSAIRKFRRISLEVGREKLGRNNTQVKLEGSKEVKKKERKRGGGRGEGG